MTGNTGFINPGGGFRVKVLGLREMLEGTKKGSPKLITAFSKEQLASMGRVATPEAIRLALAPEEYFRFT